jgi:acetoacetyl-CoA reductase
VEKRLADRVALVTGSSRGIGKAIAKSLAAEGATLAVHYCRERAGADELAAELGRGGTRAAVFQCDVAKPSECQQLIEQVKKQLGPVDILVNNAGINRDKTLRKMSAAEWDEVLQTNLSSVFHCSKAAIEPMIARKWGRIVSMASIIGQTGSFGQANYAAAKAGVIAFTKSVALEVARYGVTVNAICPGFVETDMTAPMPRAVRDAVTARIPLGRFGVTDEVARLVRFLCTEGDWITGAQLNINGGQFM